LDFVKNNWHLIALAFVSGAMLLWPMVRRAAAGGSSVSAFEATQLINREDALVLDVRDASEYAKGHVLGAKSAPLGELEKRAADLARHKDKPVIVVCESGNRSAGAAAQLRRLGFARACSLAGGLPAWQQAGLPVEK
jgi:rhodanese-related sulfurtransferase